MIDEKKLLAEELNKYIKLEKTQEECTGFIDGFEKALEVVKNCSIPDVSECVTWTTDQILNIIEENEHLDDLKMFFTEHGR